MEEEKERFDFHHHIKQSNGMNVTENKLYDAMKEIGLNPLPQYMISRLTVDFAFPDEKIVIEINGPYHETEEQQQKDKKQWYFLKNNGWKVKSYKASWVYDNPKKYAWKIAELVGFTEDEVKINEEQTSEEERPVGRMPIPVQRPEPFKKRFLKKFLVISFVLVMYIFMVKIFDSLF